MQSFVASLSHYRLSLVVPALLDRRLFSGMIRVERGAIRRAFVFREGLLVAERSNEPREHLAQVLSNLGVLDVERAAQAYEQARRAQVPYGTFLVERGHLDRARLVEALSHKAQEAFFDCYTWESGEMEIRHGTPDADDGVALRLPLATLHRDAMARLLEWRTFRDVFPTNDATFRVHRHIAVDWRSEADEALLARAEKGATLGELLASVPEGQLLAARRVLQLHRRGVLTARDPSGPRIGDSPDPSSLVGLARRLIDDGRYEAAAAVAAQALERTPCPEACVLYREAEERMGGAIPAEIAPWEGQIETLALPSCLPEQITAADLYLHSLLKETPSLREALRGAPMGELEAFRSLRRLLAAGLVRFTAAGRRQTNPYGIPVVRS